MVKRRERQRVGRVDEDNGQRGEDADGNIREHQETSKNKTFVSEECAMRSSTPQWYNNL